MVKSILSAVILLMAIIPWNQAMAVDSLHSFRLKMIQSQQDEPALQVDEDEGNFAPGSGGTAKNTESVVDKSVTFGEPTAGGSGCPENTVGIALTPDKKTLSLIFDAFIAQAGESAGVRKDVKSCMVNVPMKVPAGLQFTVVKIDYRGYNLVPEKAKNKYVTMYSLADAKNKRQISRRVRRSFEFKGALDDVYTVSSEIKNAIWSPCGTDVTLRIDARAVATTNRLGEDTMATIDSVDASVGNTQAGYHLKWRKCNPVSTSPWTGWWSWVR